MLSEGSTKSIKNVRDLAKLTIVIVTYNAQSTLQTCLNSIYRQKYFNIELVVIDGGSNDATVKILQDNSNNIYYWISEKDNGIYDAMNKALKHITGDWVYFLGADDELLDDFSAMANELKDPKAIYYGNVLWKGEKKSGPVSDYSIAKYGIFHQTLIYPKTVFQKFTYDTKYKVRADHVLNMKCVKDQDFHFIFKDFVIAKYNHTGVSDNFVDESFEKDQASLVFENFSFKTWLRFMFWRFKKYFKNRKK